MSRLLHSVFSGRTARRSRIHNPRRLQFETCEPRSMLSVTAETPGPAAIDLADAVQHGLALSGIPGIGYDGTGVKVGVIAPGIAHRTAVAGETPDPKLPANITVHPTLSGSPTDDKGTAMLEVVHSVARGAQLYFAGYPDSGARITPAQMRDAITWMMDQGVRVVVDAIEIYDEPFFEDGTGTVAESVKKAIEEGVVYVAAAGDAANRHYQGVYASSGGDFPLRHDFDAGGLVDSFLRIELPPGAEVDIVLQWSDPWGASANDYTLTLWTDPPVSVLASSTNVQNGTGNPFEKISAVRNTSNATAHANISVVKSATALARELKIFITESSGATISDNDVTPGDSIVGHKAVAGVIAVGALEPTMPLETLWPDSSRGPSTVYSNFATQTKTPRNSLAGVALHGMETRVGQLGHFPNPFHGSAASAAHTAGVVALMQHAHDAMSAAVGPMLTPPQVAALLKNTAVDIGTVGYDASTGAGLFDATAVVAAVQNQPKVSLVNVRNLADVHGGYRVKDRNGTTVNWGQIASAPVGGGMTQVSLTFTEPALVDQADLVVRGGGGFGSVIPSIGFAYNAATHVATWQFDPIYRDQLLLTLDGASANAVTDLDGNRLDGEWVNPTGYTDNDADAGNYPSGNGVAGGNFVFAVTILTGDADRDGRVSLADLARVQRNFGKASGAIWEDGDVTGDGAVTAADAALLASSFGADFRTWPTAPASPPSAAAIVVASTARVPEGDAPPKPARLSAQPVRQPRRPIETATDKAISGIEAATVTRVLRGRAVRHSTTPPVSSSTDNSAFSAGRAP